MWKPLNLSEALFLSGFLDDVPVEETVELMQSFVKEDFSYMEVGCGSGRISDPLNSRVANAFFVATDHSVDMLSWAKRINPGTSVQFRLMTLPWKLPYHDNGMQFIFSHATFPHIEPMNLSKLFVDMNKVLCDGCFMSHEFLDGNNPESVKQSYHFMTQGKPLYAYSRHAVEEMSSRSGFEIVGVKKSTELRKKYTFVKVVCHENG